jgi:hypothetical protein
MKREQVLPHVMSDMAARIAKGADEYGEPLTTFNGRDALQDAYEEALDLAVYLKQALMERRAPLFLVTPGATPDDPIHIAQVAGDDPNGEWPEPDWKLAPEWARHYTVGPAPPMNITHGRWWSVEPVLREDGWGLPISADGNWYGRSFAAPCWRKDNWRASLRTKPQDWPGPDWSQAPDVSHFDTHPIDGWRMSSSGKALWLIGGGAYCPAPDFGYTGDWRDSLRKRPK